MQQQVSRRTFLRGIIAVLAVVAAGIPTYGYVSRRYHHSLIVTALREKLDYVQLDEAGLANFANDYLERYGTARMAGLARRDEIDVHYVATLFLMSSDFFWFDADMSRTVNYLTLHNPYRGCGTNPFARLA